MGYHPALSRAQNTRVEVQNLPVPPLGAGCALWIPHRGSDREDPRREPLDAAPLGERRAHRAAADDGPVSPVQPGAVEGPEAYQVSARSAAPEYARDQTRAERC